MFLTELGFGWPREREVSLICQMVLGQFFTNDESFGTSTYEGYALYWSSRLSDALLDARNGYEVFTSVMDVGAVSVWGPMAAIRCIAQNAIAGVQVDGYVRPPSIFYPISGAPMGVTVYQVEEGPSLAVPAYPAGSAGLQPTLRIADAAYVPIVEGEPAPEPEAPGQGASAGVSPPLAERYHC